MQGISRTSLLPRCKSLCSFSRLLPVVKQKSGIRTLKTTTNKTFTSSTTSTTKTSTTNTFDAREITTGKTPFDVNSHINTIRGNAKPTVTITPEQTSLQQLMEITKLPLWQIHQDLVHKKFTSPLLKLNYLSPKAIEALLRTFTKALTTEFQYCIGLFDTKSESADDASLLMSLLKVPNSDKRRPIHDMTLVDFINPRLKNITQLLCCIETNSIPPMLLDHYQITRKSELITIILSKLMYKHYIEHALLIQHDENHNTESPATMNLSNPAEWFPEARKMKRKLIMHVGPTNSGKTHNSLQKFAQAKSGYYAGPLRLLAREIFERFNSQGIRCNLVTGEEVVPSIDEFGKISDLSSGTIEMIPLSKKMDICIIDEIQMIADESRGDAWTNAVLGVQAKEVHMCGEERAVPLIKKLARITGDELEIKNYKRLGKLTVLDKPVGSFNKLVQGDCIVVFSKRKILELKCQIERSTKLKVGVIYGALPPEIRSKEATSFNNGEYDVLVASDAVGMGLNLKIKRIVFWQTLKFNGTEMENLSISATKQIAGRAGRYSEKTGASEGFVTTFHGKDLAFVKDMMNQSAPDITKACIWPTPTVWLYYMSKFPKGTSFFDVLYQFDLETKKKNLTYYFLTELNQKFEILRLFLQENLYRSTTIYDQLALSIAPVNLGSSSLMTKTAFQFFKNISRCETKNVVDFNFLHMHILKRGPDSGSVEKAVEVLQLLEENHKLVLLFLWLSQRWPTLFVDKESATDIKTLIEKRISEELVNMRRLMKQERKRFK